MDMIDITLEGKEYKMRDGFIRVAAATPDIKVADPVFNAGEIWKIVEEDHGVPGALFNGIYLR